MRHPRHNRQSVLPQAKGGKRGGAPAPTNDGGDVALRATQRAQQQFAAAELAILAQMKRSGVSDRDARRKAAAGGTRSKNEASRKKRQSDTIDKNPTLADDIATGEMGEEQLDAIAGASEKSGGDAATDGSLIDEIKNSAPDDASKIASRWIERRNDDGTKSRHERQREKRKVWFGYDPAAGCDGVTGHGDNESMAEVKRRVRERADELYERDGGRELPADQHPRTHSQRMYDAFHQLIMGTPATATDESGVRSRQAASPTSPRHMIHTFLTVDDTDAQTIRAHTAKSDGYLPDP